MEKITNIISKSMPRFNYYQYMAGSSLGLRLDEIYGTYLRSSTCS